MSEINDFIERLSSEPETIKFEEVIDIIDRFYDFTPTAFQNGAQKNKAGENNGSCKVLSFANLHDLTEAQALNLFAQYYRDVVATPQGDDHQNIRQFIEQGYQGLVFDQFALHKSDNG